MSQLKAPGCATRTTWLIQRVLFLMAGLVTLLGVILTVVVSRWFLSLSALAGANQLLMVATGCCPMSALLARLRRQAVTDSRDSRPALSFSVQRSRVPYTTGRSGTWLAAAWLCQSYETNCYNAGVAWPSDGMWDVGESSRARDRGPTSISHPRQRNPVGGHGVVHATTLAAAQTAAETVRNLIVGPHGPNYGDTNGDGTIEGATIEGLLPGLHGEPSLAQPGHSSSCVTSMVLGGTWSDPSARWAQALHAVNAWTPTHDTFPTLPSQPQRLYGWASLTLKATDSALQSATPPTHRCTSTPPRCDRAPLGQRTVGGLFDGEKLLQLGAA